MFVCGRVELHNSKMGFRALSGMSCRWIIKDMLTVKVGAAAREGIEKHMAAGDGENESD